MQKYNKLKSNKRIKLNPITKKKQNVYLAVQGARRFGEKNVKSWIFAFAKVKNPEIIEVQNNYQIHKQTIYQKLIYD